MTTVSFFPSHIPIVLVAHLLQAASAADARRDPHLRQVVAARLPEQAQRDIILHRQGTSLTMLDIAHVHTWCEATLIIYWLRLTHALYFSLPIITFSFPSLNLPSSLIHSLIHSLAPSLACWLVRLFVCLIDCRHRARRARPHKR